ncbi:hypothetical protein HPB51_017733 [Rhipicephalus microplus]|uniref:Peptidase S1 domain-containing protein n=1 Tax=Rhipicephalus microplus TaxID=6941 RepID=A0A9J6E291_RHIMP|nr:hypothetical protein HPB51_017733 [Rhipicephalus microplus]
MVAQTTLHSLNTPSITLRRTILTHDVVVLKLSLPVNYTAHVRPVCLPGPGEHLPLNTTCYATGWGNTRGSGHSFLLKQARLVVRDFNQACAGILSIQPNLRKEYLVCAVDESDDSGPCHQGSVTVSLGKTRDLKLTVEVVTENKALITKFADQDCGGHDLGTGDRHSSCYDEFAKCLAPDQTTHKPQCLAMLPLSAALLDHMKVQDILVLDMSISQRRQLQVLGHMQLSPTSSLKTVNASYSVTLIHLAMTIVIVGEQNDNEGTREV